MKFFNKEIVYYTVFNRRLNKTIIKTKCVYNFSRI